MLYEHGDENFFVLMMQPPAKPAASQVLAREYIFLLDVSGSMSGFPLDTARSLMKNLLSDLNAGDYFNIVAFAGASWVMSDKSVQATPGNINDAFKKVNSFAGGGGTELLEGLKSAYGVPAPADGKISRSVVVITDGYVSVEAKAFKTISDRLSEANLFAFGIGSGVNRYVIEGMARAGLGEPFVVLNSGKAKEESDRFREYVLRPVLTGIEVKYDGFKTYDDAPRKVPDLMAERPIVLFGKYKGKAAGTITIRGSAGDGKFERTIAIDAKDAKKGNLPIRVLWARKWSEILEDRLCLLPGDKDVKKAITGLGLHYSMLTAFTSFVAVDKHKTNKSGKVTAVKQPLPLPEGVPDNAIGALMGQQIGASFGIGGLGLKGTGVGGGGVGSYPMALGQLKSSAQAAKVASPFGSSSGQVMGSISMSAVRKIFKKAVAGNKALKAALSKCPCSGMKLEVLMKFDDGGKVKKLSVKVTGGGGECACGKTVVKAVREALEKELKDEKFPAAAGIQITCPLIMSN
ncbi:MAG: VWA domain-containing protein [Pseudomonadota bacterium]